jgi:hypothetical protein
MKRIVVSFVVVAAAGCVESEPRPPEVVVTRPTYDEPPAPPPETIQQTCDRAAAFAAMTTSAPFPGATLPRLPATFSRAVAPPAISGGTLRVLADGVTAVAADPDRDRLYVVDLAGQRLAGPAVELQPGDEPGRLVEDAAGRVHVALRGGNALVTIDPASGRILGRRAACAAPRGLAYEAARDLVHVACAGGDLISLPAAGGPATRVVRLREDLRDVVVEGPRLRVSRFRSAEILTVEADGTLSSSLAPPAFQWPGIRGNARFEPAVAWRLTPGGGDGSLVLLHQRGLAEALPPFFGGSYYGNLDPCGAIVHTAVTVVAPDGTMRPGPALPGLVLAVDMAVSADGRRVAFVSAGNATNAPEGQTPSLPRLFVTDLESATQADVGCRYDGVHGPCMPNPFFTSGLIPYEGDDDTLASDDGAPPPSPCDGMGHGSPQTYLFGQDAQPIAVAFDGAGGVVVQSREPAALILDGGARIPLSDTSAFDTGHALFHANSSGQIACASCHPEGRDDGRVWSFTCGGLRRTQSLQTGIAGTEPFHWDGRERSFDQLVDDVFVRRMSGPPMTPDEVAATLSWLDRQPRLTRPAPRDPAAVERGRALFTDARIGCASCHAGERLTNNETADVGTGAPFQVPSLVGVGSRAPYLHDGCAPTLLGRFGACGGGDKHGVTSGLDAKALGDLVAYLEGL